MFYNKELKEVQDIYNNLKEQYLKLRKEHWALIKELDNIKKQDDKIEQLKETIEKLSKDLAYKTELLTEYHLKFGDECLELIEKKRSRIKNRTSKKGNDNNEGVEL